MTPRLALVMIAACLGALMAVPPGPASAQIEVLEAWSRATAPNAPAGAAYMTLENVGSVADRLVAAESDIARTVEIHTHLLENGVARMRRIEAIEIEPGAPVLLAPGGLHVMFIDLKRPFRQGERVPLTLVFERAGRVDVEAAVMAPGARGPAPHGTADGHHAAPGHGHGTGAGGHGAGGHGAAGHHGRPMN